jgi:Tol biopolymer transport system component
MWPALRAFVETVAMGLSESPEKPIEEGMLSPAPSSLSSLLVRGFGSLFGAVLISCLLSTSAAAAVPNFKGSSGDGEVVFFETEEQLVPGDTDTKRDVYARSFSEDVDAYVTRVASLGPAGGNDAYNAQFEGANGLGDLIFFSTEERLVTDDTDRSIDVYMRDLEDGTTTLVTPGNGAFSITFADVDSTGGEVFFETREKLESADTDGSADLYLRNIAAEETTLVSAGEAGCQPGCGNGAFDISRRGISADGTFAYFTSAEPLSGADTDTAFDVYARDLEDDVTSLVSTGSCGGCGNGGAVPIFNGSSVDGTRVFFSSEEKLVESDDDEATDVYARDLPAGPTTLISGGEDDVTASFAAASPDGSKVFFTSAEALIGADVDGANDVYLWTAEELDLITSAPCASFCGATFDAIGADSTEVIFTTSAALVPADQDNRDDIYRQDIAGSAPMLVSRGEGSCPSCWNGVFDARFNQASADGSRVVFTTGEGVLADDDDGEDDIYLRDVDDGTSSLITIAPSFCPLKKGNCGATYVGSSGDGLRVFFRTVERFTLEDGDNEADVYERFLGDQPSEEITRLVSTGNDPNLDLGPAPPALTGTDPESPASVTTPRVLGEADGSAVKIYDSEDCSGEPLASGTADELLEPGLTVTIPPGSLTEFRATAEAEGFVSDCSQPISYFHLSEEGGLEEEGEEVWEFVTPKVKLAPSVPEPAFLTPRTRITFAPASKTRSRSPVFRFTDSTGQDGTTFQCKVDRKPWKRCSSPLRLKRLGSGRHVLQIKGVNAVGEAEPKPVKRSFKVVPR